LLKADMRLAIPLAAFKHWTARMQEGDMSQTAGKKSRADIAREYMIAHARQAAAVGWECGRCGTANNPAEEFCVQCGADGQGAKRILNTSEVDTTPVLIVTMNEIPGYLITKIHGDVFGLVVRARNYFSNLGAQFATIVGGEATGYTKLLTDSRNQARERMWREARARGANAIVAMRFDCNEIADIMSEVVAYGTAVTVQPDTASFGEASIAQPVQPREL
jgi:uncharacterized protein YbjQ (UPF0145 family)